MNSPVQKIKERLSIEEVVSSYIKLEQSGINLKARCPFHSEKTPSFFVSPSRNSYYCFGCGASGDIFSFVESFEGLDFKGALKLLANKAGVILSDFNQEKEGEKERLYKILEEATDFFVRNLNDSPEVLVYLKNRGIDDKSVKDFRLGFIKNDWRLLYGFLKTKGFSDSEIENAGLAKKTDKGFYDRFRGRIMFPINDSSGRVIAFSGRLFEDDGKSAKYLNSPETIVFNKSMVLYGLDKAKEHIRKNNFSILVEGQMDLVLSHQSGFKNTIATSGTALSDVTVSKENVISNLGLVRRLSPNIVLAFDADKAGFNASSKAGKIALSLDMDVKVANLPEGMDPADVISKLGVDAWREAIRGSKHVIEFILNQILKKNSSDMLKTTREIKEKLLPYIVFAPSAIEQSHFIKMISDRTGINEQALKDDFQKISKESMEYKEELISLQNTENRLIRRDYIERKLFGILLWQKSLTDPILDIDSVLKELNDFLNQDSVVILDNFAKNKEDLIYEAEVFYEDNKTLEKDFHELVNNYKEEILKSRLIQKMQELQNAEKDKDINKTNKILAEYQIINNQIETLKNSRLK